MRYEEVRASVFPRSQCGFYGNRAPRETISYTHCNRFNKGKEGKECLRVVDRETQGFRVLVEDSDYEDTHAKLWIETK